MYTFVFLSFVSYSLFGCVFNLFLSFVSYNLVALLKIIITKMILVYHYNFMKFVSKTYDLHFTIFQKILAFFNHRCYYIKASSKTSMRGSAW